MDFIRCLARLSLLAVVLAPPASAQDYVYALFVDADDRSATGCASTVGTTTLAGTELRISARVTGTQVTSVTRAACVGGTFGAEAAIGGPHPVGLNVGRDGGDAIELAIDRALLGSGTTVRVALGGSNATGAASDVLAGGALGLSPLIVVLVPTLGLLGVALLIAALLFVASRRMRIALAAVGMVLVAGAVWAANFVVDGAVGDWAGVAAMATDPDGDGIGSDPGVDLLALFAAEEAGRVFFRIDVRDLESRAPVAAAQALTIDEDSGARAIVLSAVDEDGDPLTYAIATPPTRGALSGFDANTGAVTYTPAANAEGADGFTFTANDGTAASVPATVAITLSPVNDAPVANDATFGVVENAANGTLVGTPVVAAEVDTTAPNATLGYAITAGNGMPPGVFAIDASTGQITVADGSRLDFDTTPRYTLTVTVTDGGAPPLSDTATITIDVGDANDPPAFQGEPYAFTLPEHSAAGTLVGTAAATDPDAVAPNNALTWTITSGNAGGAFAIDAATGRITVANGALLDFETTPNLVLGVGVADGGTPQGSDATTVAIALTDVNEAPVVNGATFSVPEHSAVPTAVGTATATDVDVPAQALTWSITGGNTGGTFAIAPTTGAISVAANAALDFETNPAFALTVQANDGGTPGLSGSATVVVQLADINEAPVFVGEPYQATIDENTPNGTVAIDVGATDVDAATTLVYAITGGNGTPPGAFAIDAAGAITVNDSTQIDFNLGSSYALSITATDDGTPALTDTSTVTIAIADLNEPPEFQGEPYSFAIDENAAAATAVGSAPATDEDLPAQTLTWTIASGNAGGTFAIGAGGAITVAVPPDFETTSAYTLGIVVTDDGTGTLADTSTATITIGNVNEAPVNTVPATQTIGTGLSLGFSTANGNAVAVADVDAGAGTITTAITTTLGTFDATAVGGAVVTGGGTNALTIAAALADLNATLQTLSYASAAGGSAAVTVSTSDAGNTGSGGMQSDSDGFTINVDAAPTVTASMPAANANVADTQALSIVFSESVTTFNGDAVTLSCNGGANLIAGGATGTNVTALTPTYAGTLPSGACVLTVIAANVGDDDGIDPPDTMQADFVRAFTVDSAPAVVSTTPADGASGVAANATITVAFSEDVDATAGAFALDCGAGAIALAPDTIAGDGAIAMTPGTPLPATSTCTLTIAGANITDTDTADAPDAMAGTTVVTFTTTDQAPSVVSTVPVDTGTLAANADVAITFSEPVQFALGSFSFACTNAGAIPFAISASPGTTVTLDPTGVLPVGETCTVTVDDAGIADVDTIDPPQAPAADHVFSFMPVDTPPTSTDDAASTQEDVTLMLAAADFGTHADTEGAPLASVRITALETDGDLEFDTTGAGAWSDVVLNQDVPASDLAAGRLRFVPDPDEAGAPYATIGFRVGDGIGLSAAAYTLTITVTAVDDAPASTDDAVSTNEDVALQLAAGDFGTYYDPESAPLAAVRISALETNGDLEYDTTGASTWTDVTLNQVVPAADLAAGRLRFVPDPDENGAPYATIGFQVGDGAGFSAAYVLTVDVASIDDAPVSSNDSASTSEDTALVLATGDFGAYADADADPLASVRITTLESAGDLEFDTTGGGAWSDVTLNQDVTAAHIAAGRLRFVPAADASGSPYATLGFTVHDGTAASVAYVLTIDVVAVNDPPTSTDDATSTSEDVAVVLATTDFGTYADVEGTPLAAVRIGTLESAGDLEFDTTGGGAWADVASSQIIAAAHIAAGRLRFVPAANAFGTPYATIGYDVGDGTDFSAASYVLTVTVLPVNDAPVAQDKAHATHSAIGLTIAAADAGELMEGVSDADDTPAELTVDAVLTGIVPSGATATVLDTADGSFHFEPPGGYSGSATFQYRVCDDGDAGLGLPAACSAYQTVTIAVTGPELWFVDATPATACTPTCNGSNRRPYASLAALPNSATRGTGDRIFVAAGTYASGHTFSAGEHLIGEGSTGTLSTHLGVVGVSNGTLDALPALSGPAPTLQGTVTAATSSRLRGVAISATAATGYAASGATGIEVMESTVDSTGTAITVATSSAGASGVTFSATRSTGGTHGIVMNGITGGAFSFGSGISGTGLSGHTTAGLYAQDIGNAQIAYAGPIAPGGTARAVLVGINGTNGSGLEHAAASLSLSGALTGGGVALYESTAGTITLSNASQTFSTGAADAIELIDNAGATIAFSGGGLALTTTAGHGIDATGGGTVNITGNDNTIATTGSGSTVNWAMTSGVHSSGTLRFRTIAKSGSGTKGLVVHYHDGSFAVTGDDNDNGVPDSLTSGGTFTGTSARGVEFVDVDGGVSLGGMTFTNATTADGAAAADCGNALQTAGHKNCNAPIYLDTVANAALHTIDVNGSVQAGIIGYDVDGLTLTGVTSRNGGSTIDENGGAAFKNLRGTVSVTGSSFRDNTRAQFDITTTAGNTTGNVSFLDNEFTGNRAPNLSAQGLLIVNGGTMGTVNVGDGTAGNVNDFHDSFSNGLQYAGGPGATAATLNIDRNTFTNVNSAVVLQVAGVGTASSLTYAIRNNSIVAGALTGSGAIITSATQGHVLSGSIQSNTIGTSGVANSGAVCNSCNGITVDHDGFGRHDVSIVGNVVQRIKSIGIYYQVADASGNVVITGNLVREPEGSPSSGIYVQSGTTAADNGCVAATIGGTVNAGFPSTAANAMNAVEGSWDPAGFQSEVFVWRRFATVMNLPGLSGGETAWIGARNSIPDATGADVTVSGTPFGNAGSCP